MIKIRDATVNDSKEFAELFLFSAPYFPILFGGRIESILKALFTDPFNLFSFRHVYFAEVNGKNAGMLLGYSFTAKKRENLHTGLLLFKHVGVELIAKIPTLLRFSATVGKMNEHEYYISNIATYREYRGQGVGRSLMVHAENIAKLGGEKNLILDVETENNVAVNFYKKLGYKVRKSFLIPLYPERKLHFYRMQKIIQAVL